MRRRALLLGLLAGLSGGAYANSPMTLTGSGAGRVVGYSGPGDLSPGASFFLALRPYNAANLNASQVVNLRRSSDNATSDFGFTDGYLDQTAIAAWGGTSATGTGAITGTTLTFTGGVIGGQVTGTGVTAGTFIVSGASPAWTVNISQTVVSTTLTVANGLFVAEVYDQTGNGAHGIQATTANQPIFLLNVVGTELLPTMAGVASSTINLSITLSAVAQPFTLSAVFDHYSSAVNNRFIGPATGIGVLTTATGVRFAMGSILNATSSDFVFHADLFVGNGASGVISVDGTETTGAVGATGIGTTLTLLAPFVPTAAGSPTFHSEFGLWPSALDASTRAAVVTNMRNWWGL